MDNSVPIVWAVASWFCAFLLFGAAMRDGNFIAGLILALTCVVLAVFWMNEIKRPTAGM